MKCLCSGNSKRVHTKGKNGDTVSEDSAFVMSLCAMQPVCYGAGEACQRNTSNNTITGRWCRAVSCSGLRTYDRHCRLLWREKHVTGTVGRAGLVAALQGRTLAATTLHYTARGQGRQHRNTHTRYMLVWNSTWGATL